MGAMNEFLHWITQPAAAQLYATANARCDEFVRATNQSLIAHSLPIRLVNLSTVWTVLFKQPGRFNWLLQYYMRAQGLTLSWVGTGRCLSSLDFSTEDYKELTEKILTAARQMQEDAWWLTEDQVPGREKVIRRRVIKEVVGTIVRVPASVHGFYDEVMRRKHDDHIASHSNLVNQSFHLLSSSVFIFCYIYAFRNLTVAMSLGLAALFVRQFGHAILEPPCHDKEQRLLGFTTRSKSLVVAIYFLIPLAHLIAAGSYHPAILAARLPTIAFQWFLFTLAAVLGHALYLVWLYNLRSSLVWLIKLVTDPLTDLAAY
jgi:glutamate-1-semialdehyde 2,1-aminomutase